MTAWNRPRGGALGLLVLGLHLMLGLALHQLLRPPVRGPAVATPVHVWISLRPDPPARPQPQRETADPPARRTEAPPLPAAPPRPATRAAEPQAITVPAATAPVATPVAAPVAAPVTAPHTAAADAAPAPLNLALPSRPASAPPPNAWTRHDPRVHDALLDGDQRPAHTLGTDTTLRTARRGDGFELRRGNDCVQVQPSRAGQIFMPDGGARPPSQVGKC